jgi:hypothetical protein
MLWSGAPDHLDESWSLRNRPFRLRGLILVEWGLANDLADWERLLRDEVDWRVLLDWVLVINGMSWSNGHVVGWHGLDRVLVLGILLELSTLSVFRFLVLLIRNVGILLHFFEDEIISLT